MGKNHQLGAIFSANQPEPAPADLIVTKVDVKYFNQEGNVGDYYYATVKNIGGDLTFIGNNSSGILGVNFYGGTGWLGSSNESVVYVKKQYASSDVIKNSQEIEIIGPSINQTSVGTYTIKAIANPIPQYVAEANYQNNSLEKSITIEGLSENIIEKSNIKVENFNYSPINDQNGVDTQIEFDLKNNGDNKAEFWLAAWDETTNYPLKTEQYNLASGQTVHVQLMNVNNISRLKYGDNIISIRLVSPDSRTVYSEQKFNVTRQKTNVQVPSTDDTQISYIQDNAKILAGDKFSQILAELRQLRDIIKEQQTEIKYLKLLIKDVKAISEKAQDAINNFITYGVDSNTAKLGAGERAAVMNSYKAAFSKLPETEAELADAIKIANGRWPSVTNDAAEKKAKEQFQKIYKRIADMNNASDNAAVTVMAYGLRQKAENRNLNSEKQGIKIFKGIYGHAPNTTEEWNIMQAITYSGAGRGTDSDGDLLTDAREAELGTDPKNKDTDGDGHLDGVEVANGFDPLKK